MKIGKEEKMDVTVTNEIKIKVVVHNGDVELVLTKEVAEKLYEDLGKVLNKGCIYYPYTYIPWSTTTVGDEKITGTLSHS